MSSNSEQLGTPVQFLKGIGPQRGPLFERLGLLTVRDVLFHFPRDYQDLTDERDVPDLEDGRLQTVRGVVEDIDARSTARGRSILGVLVRAKSGYVRALWFNQPLARERFFIGQRLLVSGKAKRNGLMWEMAHPRVENLGDEEDAPPAGRILPVYPSTEGLLQWQIRRGVRVALQDFAPLVDEVFPPSFLAEKGLCPIVEALPQIHFPSSQASLERARRRFVYQELFVLQLALAVKRRQHRSTLQAPRLEASPRIDARIRRLFPYNLTEGQEAAIADVVGDMGSLVPMNRLLQGDVGSGKTAVAVYAMLLAVAHGHQAVLMAPTEILARQHAATLERLLAQSRVRQGALLGGMPARQRAELVRRAAEGAVDIVVGTHALVQDDVRFAKPGLVVIDEQHKFGVRQRAVLRQAGPQPHYLVMTATPIPRTITMTLFGDLDVSTIRDAPPGRQKVRTYLGKPGDRKRWWDFVGRKLREGRQAYVVAPLVEESEQLEVASVAETYEALARGPLAAFRLGLVHGRMPAAEKDAAMAAFRTGETQVLVSTAVVEVGVDVPNATLMTIEAGERFGLAQLHQLRGRISRGSQPGFCTVFADPQTPEAEARLKAFVGTTDGFELAELDMRLRGPGELFGTRQHGLPPFRLADLARDAAVVDEARIDARAFVESDPGLARAEHARLRRMTLVRYGQALDLADVG